MSIPCQKDFFIKAVKRFIPFTAAFLWESDITLVLAFTEKQKLNAKDCMLFGRSVGDFVLIKVLSLLGQYRLKINGR